MAEQPVGGEQTEKQEIVLPDICMETVKNAAREIASTPSSPIALRKTPSVKYNCLCSPTTHAGSFRCRYHRSLSLGRGSMSLGSKLSELTSKIK